MEPLGPSIHRLAGELRVPPTRISEIVNERRAITADAALRLARYFRSTPELWMSLQQYDLGYFDDETCRLEPIENPFGPKVLPMFRNELSPM
jgi:antitoxin HigA-1